MDAGTQLPRKVALIISTSKQKINIHVIWIPAIPAGMTTIMRGKSKINTSLDTPLNTQYIDHPT
jgi:hypothetical protein